MGGNGGDEFGLAFSFKERVARRWKKGRVRLVSSGRSRDPIGNGARQNQASDKGDRNGGKIGETHKRDPPDCLKQRSFPPHPLKFL